MKYSQPNYYPWWLKVLSATHQYTETYCSKYIKAFHRSGSKQKKSIAFQIVSRIEFILREHLRPIRAKVRDQFIKNCKNKTEIAMGMISGPISW